MRDAVSDRGVNGVLGDVPAYPEIIVAGRILGKRAALHLHLVRRLPGARDHFTDPSHGLRVAGDHAEYAQVVKDILRRDGLGTNAALGERNVLRHQRIQVMTYHQHVQMLGDGVHGIRPRGIRR